MVDWAALASRVWQATREAKTVVFKDRAATPVTYTYTDCAVKKSESEQYAERGINVEEVTYVYVPRLTGRTKPRARWRMTVEGKDFVIASVTEDLEAWTVTSE